MSNAEELIRTARDTIGKADSDEDWKIVPTEHAERFAKGASLLAETLRGARPQGFAEMYDERNAKAMNARDVFKSTVGRADTAVFCTAGLGALLLVTAGLQEPLGGAGRWVVAAIGLLGLVSGGLATMWLGQVKGGELAKRWADERAKAEAKRLAYFKAVMEGAPEAPSDQLLALEYTRRFLLDNQIDYFRDRGGQHENAAGAALKTSTHAVFIASTFTAAAGLLSVLLPLLAVIAGLGVIATAYGTLAVSRSVVNLDRKNADRYGAAADQLKERRLDLDVYRKKTGSGEQGAVQEFFEPVFVALEADHKAFLSHAELRESAIGGMERRLGAAKEMMKEKSGGEADDQ